MTHSSHTDRSLDCFFRPRHVAVIGASRSPGKLGNTVLRNLVAGGFAGTVSAINAKGEAVDATPGYRSIADLPSQVDCAFLAIPAAATVDALRDCAEAGVRCAIIGSSGYAELDTPQGRERQRALEDIARTTGMRLLGPNTNGILNTAEHLSLGYNASHSERFEPGDISIVSHSGALFDGIAKRLRAAGAGIAKFVPVGNEVDIAMLDVVDYLIADPSTRVIGLVIEGLGDGERLKALAAGAAAAGKWIVALKIGRTASGAGAAFAHSSRLAGSTRAYAALMDACGIATVNTVEALAGTCALLSGRSLPAVSTHDGLVCVTTSGAGGAILADFASDRGMTLAGTEGATWSGRAKSTIEALGLAAAIRNPIDMGSLGDWALLSPVLDALAADHYNGPTVVYAHVAPGPGMAAHMAAPLIERRLNSGTPVLVLSPGGLGEAEESAYTAAGIPVFHDTAACFDSLEGYATAMRLRAAVEPMDASPNASAPRGDSERQAVHEAIAAAAAASHPHRFMGELDSARILQRSGVPMVQSRVVRSAAEARDAATAAGGPVVLKAIVPGVAHKNAHGFVKTRISDGAAAALEFERLVARVGAAGFAVERTEFVVQPMMTAELELIVGVTREPGLGRFLVFGLGGIYTEVLDQVELLAIPATPARLSARLAASRVGHMLRAIGRQDADALLVKVGAALLALQGLVIAHGEQIDSIDVNPLLVNASDCLAVDALVVMPAPDGLYNGDKT